MQKIKPLVLTLWVLLATTTSLSAQAHLLKVKVCDQQSKACIQNARILTTPNNQQLLTDKYGVFTIDTNNTNIQAIRIEHIGYESVKIGIQELKSNQHIHLKPINITLNELTVTANSRHTLKSMTLSSKSLGRNFILKNNATNLSQTLSRIAGVSSMDIGAGMSKPIVRGMGFNRLAVVDKGIILQNQQWGADHGLETDQFDVDRILIHKGPMSLYFGSDAIGGVIEILPIQVPKEELTWGDATFIAKSNNGLLGTSLMLSRKHKNWFVRGRVTSMYYGDYRIPTDTITYLTWKMPIANRRVKNTAGRETNASLMLNYKKREFSTSIFVSDNYAKNGFFPGSHGIPDLRRLISDGNHYNIDYPYSLVNHFKISNTIDWQLDHWDIHTDIGFQNNYREELALFHTHYSNQPTPKNKKNTELAFSLNTYSANVRLRSREDDNWEKSLGIMGELQDNRVDGYNFLLPDFQRKSLGLYLASVYKLSSHWTLTGGLRYDIGAMNILEHYDPILDEYLRIMQVEPNLRKQYALRAISLQKSFQAVTGAIGAMFRPNKMHLMKINIGRSFRFPSANELASNGVHHGAFRHEQGNTTLQPEIGIQMDMAYELKLQQFKMSVSPFASLFSNYIYLQPTGKWSILPHAGQLYRYQQARVCTAGGELEVNYTPHEMVQLSSNIEYLYTLNLDTYYPLPFSPPTKWTGNLVITDHGKGILNSYSVNFETQKIFTQNRISINEEATNGVFLFNLMGSLNWIFGQKRFITEIQVYNIFDTPFLNHLSFYRQLNAPEQGRNIQFIFKIPF